MLQFVKTEWSTDGGVGKVCSIKLSNINILANNDITPAVGICGDDARKNSNNINFENILINGKAYIINL